MFEPLDRRAYVRGCAAGADGRQRGVRVRARGQARVSGHEDRKGDSVRKSRTRGSGTGTGPGSARPAVAAQRIRCAVDPPAASPVRYQAVTTSALPVCAPVSLVAVRRRYGQRPLAHTAALLRVIVQSPASLLLFCAVVSPAAFSGTLHRDSTPATHPIIIVFFFLTSHLTLSIVICIVLQPSACRAPILL